MEAPGEGGDLSHWLEEGWVGIAVGGSLVGLSSVSSLVTGDLWGCLTLGSCLWGL